MIISFPSLPIPPWAYFAAGRPLSTLPAFARRVNSRLLLHTLAGAQASLGRRLHLDCLAAERAFDRRESSSLTLDISYILCKHASRRS